MQQRLDWLKDITSSATKAAMPNYIACSWFNYHKVRSHPLQTLLEADLLHHRDMTFESPSWMETLPSSSTLHDPSAFVSLSLISAFLLLGLHGFSFAHDQHCSYHHPTNLLAVD